MEGVSSVSFHISSFQPSSVCRSHGSLVIPLTISSVSSETHEDTSLRNLLFHIRPRAPTPPSKSIGTTRLFSDHDAGRVDPQS